MKSIFDADDNAELVYRVNQLYPDTKALWGQMDPAQMMTHCAASMGIAFGLSKCPRHWIGTLFGNISKKRMLKTQQFDRYMPAHFTLRIEHTCNFDDAKKNFLTIIQTAYTKGEPGLVKYPHPYFGTFEPGEWHQLNWKHLDHHLRQFGV
jgi:hypothetical protein